MYPRDVVDLQCLVEQMHSGYAENPSNRARVVVLQIKLEKNYNHTDR